MNITKNILYIVTGLLLVSCGSFSNKVENEDTVKPFLYEMTFQDSREGAEKAFFNDNIPGFSYKIVVPNESGISQDRWKTILDKVHPDISTMNEIYYASGKSPVEKHNQIKALLAQSGDRTELHQSILEQVAGCRMLHLLKSEENVSPELVAEYLDVLLSHNNTSYSLQLNALKRVEGYWSSQKFKEAKKHLHELAGSQLAEAETFLASVDQQGSKQSGPNYEVMEVKTKVEVLDQVLSALNPSE